jgi:hypothetical protein
MAPNRRSPRNSATLGTLSTASTLRARLANTGGGAEVTAC